MFVIGTLVGLEIPLLMRILKDELDFKDLYLARSRLRLHRRARRLLLFPLFLVPKLGLNRTSLFSGCSMRRSASGRTWLLEPLIKTGRSFSARQGFHRDRSAAIAFIKADNLTSLAEEALFVDNIIYAKSSSYQRIVVTKGKTGYALFLKRKSAVQFV